MGGEEDFTYDCECCVEECRCRRRLPGWMQFSLYTIAIIVFLLMAGILTCDILDAWQSKVKGADWSNVPRTQKNLDKAVVEFGQRVFFDAGVCSLLGTMSCASCHNPDPEYGYSDALKIAVGAMGVQGNGLGLIGIRRTPSLIDCYVLKDRDTNCDGRAPGLSSSCLQAVADIRVLGMPNIDTMVARINSRPEYRELAEFIYKQPAGVDEGQLRYCLVEFLCTIRAYGVPADLIEAGIKTGLPAGALRGRALFQKHCEVCHVAENRYQDFEYHNIGINAYSGSTDLGRGQFTGRPEDERKFRTRGLVDCAKRPPYMHDGCMADLPEVVHFFAMGGAYVAQDGRTYRDTDIDPLIARIKMTPDEERDMVEWCDLGYQTPPEGYPKLENPWKKK